MHRKLVQKMHRKKNRKKVKKKVKKNRTEKMHKIKRKLGYYTHDLGEAYIKYLFGLKLYIFWLA